MAITSFADTSVVAENDENVQIVETENGIITITTIKDDENERVVITDSDSVDFIIKATLNKQTGDAVFEEIPKAKSSSEEKVVVMRADRAAKMTNGIGIPPRAGERFETDGMQGRYFWTKWTSEEVISQLNAY